MMQKFIELLDRMKVHYTTSRKNDTTLTVTVMSLKNKPIADFEFYDNYATEFIDCKKA